MSNSDEAAKLKLLLECYKKKYDEALDRLDEETCEELSLCDLAALAMFHVMMEGNGGWKWPT